MYEIVTARLDESYTVFATGERVTRERRDAFRVVPVGECEHASGATICADCAPSWQQDYEFDDPFPFDRATRTSLADVVTAAGLAAVGLELVMDGPNGTQVTAVVTTTGGLMLPDGRVFDNPSAAANAVNATRPTP